MVGVLKLWDPVTALFSRCWCDVFKGPGLSCFSSSCCSSLWRPHKEVGGWSLWAALVLRYAPVATSPPQGPQQPNPSRWHVGPRVCRIVSQKHVHQLGAGCCELTTSCNQGSQYPCTCILTYCVPHAKSTAIAWHMFCIWLLLVEINTRNLHLLRCGLRAGHWDLCCWTVQLRFNMVPTFIVKKALDCVAMPATLEWGAQIP